jgi:hypothetical protein
MEKRPNNNVSHVQLNASHEGKNKLAPMGLHPQVPLRFTWGYSWCHLYEVGVALSSSAPSGRRLEVFLHAIRMFKLNSQKKR